MDVEREEELIEEEELVVVVFVDEEGELDDEAERLELDDDSVSSITGAIA